MAHSRLPESYQLATIDGDDSRLPESYQLTTEDAAGFGGGGAAAPPRRLPESYQLVTVDVAAAVTRQITTTGRPRIVNILTDCLTCGEMLCWQS